MSDDFSYSLWAPPSHCMLDIVFYVPSFVSDIPLHLSDILNAVSHYRRHLFRTLCPTFYGKTLDMSVQNVGHVRMSDNFSYSLRRPLQLDILTYHSFIRGCSFGPGAHFLSPAVDYKLHPG